MKGTTLCELVLQKYIRVCMGVYVVYVVCGFNYNIGYLKCVNIKIVLTAIGSGGGGRFIGRKFNEMHPVRCKKVE